MNTTEIRLLYKIFGNLTAICIGKIPIMFLVVIVQFNVKSFVLVNSRQSKAKRRWPRN